MWPCLFACAPIYRRNLRLIGDKSLQKIAAIVIPRLCRRKNIQGSASNWGRGNAARTSAPPTINSGSTRQTSGDHPTVLGWVIATWVRCSSVAQLFPFLISVSGAQSIGGSHLITGKCLCGAVSYKASSAPIVTRVCWCRLCQYIGAGSGTVNTCFARSSVIIEGSLRDFPSIADSGNRMHRRFCPDCGTHLISEAESRPHLIFIRSGTLDDPEIARPSVTIWTAEAPTWACISDSLPSFAGQAPPAA